MPAPVFIEAVTPNRDDVMAGAAQLHDTRCGAEHSKAFAPLDRAERPHAQSSKNQLPLSCAFGLRRSGEVRAVHAAPRLPSLDR